MKVINASNLISTKSLSIYEGTFYKCKYNMEKEIDAMIEAENGKLKK